MAVTALPAAERVSARTLPLLVVGAAFALAGALPLWTLLLGPILLGVPHVVGDVRVLWLQRPSRIEARTMLAIAVPIAALTLARVVAMAGAPGAPRFELGCGVFAVGIGAAIGARSARSRLAWMLPIVGLSCAAMAWPALTVVLVAHVHNLVALLWLAARRGAGARPWIVVAAAGFAAIAVVPGGPEAASAAGLSWTRCAQDLAPGLDGALADRLVRTFAFAQMVHYALWALVLPRCGGRTCRDELGRGGLLVSIVAGVVVGLLACADAAGARSTYLSLAIGHGWFEFAVAAFALARRGATS